MGPQTLIPKLKTAAVKFGGAVVFAAGSQGFWFPAGRV